MPIISYLKGIKNVDLTNKIRSMQCSWVKRLLKDDCHDWKVIPLFLIGTYLGKNFKCHNNNIAISNDLLYFKTNSSIHDIV